MLAGYKARTIIGVGLGFSLQVLYQALLYLRPQLVLLQMVCMWCGVLLFVYGCVSYSRGKGQNGAWGILGILSLVGFIILALMPYKGRQTPSGQPADPEQGQPPPPIQPGS